MANILRTFGGPPLGGDGGNCTAGIASASSADAAAADEADAMAAARITEFDQLFTADNL